MTARPTLLASQGRLSVCRGSGDGHAACSVSAGIANRHLGGCWRALNKIAEQASIAKA